MKILGLEITRTKKDNFIDAGIDRMRHGFYGTVDGISEIGGWQNDLSKTVRSNYANAFAPISAIVDEAVKRNIRIVRPDNDEIDIGPREPIWYALNHPNNRMDFMALLGIMISGFTSLNEISLLLWHHNGEKVIPGCPEGGFTTSNISGFTVLPKCCKCHNSNGEERWVIQTLKKGRLEFCDKSVITLKYGLLPDDGITGISPGSASEQESSVRDSLNIYERAFFANGAKPSLIVTIHARSKEEFIAIRNEYELANRGAGKQGGVVYQAMYDTMPQGISAGSPSIEVTPIGAVNDTLAINDIVGYTERTINGNYGISPIIWGDASTTTYQNQQLVDKKFMARVQSILVRLFSNLERELARVCRIEELPFKFCWDNTDEELTDELQTIADIRAKNVQALRGLIELGAEADKAVEALCLGEEWLGLNLVAPSQVSQTIVNVQQPEIKQEPVSVIVNNEIPVKQEIPDHYDVKIQEPEKLQTIRGLLQKIAQDRADIALGIITNDAQTDGEYVQEMLAILTTLANDGGSRTTSELQRMADALDLDIALVEYSMSNDNLLSIQNRAEQVLVGYSEFLDNQISQYKDTDPDNLDSILANALAIGIIATRADMITIGESKNAYQSGQYDAAMNTDRLLEASNCQIVKTWDASGPNPCEFCLSINGTQAGIRDSFVPDGIIHAGDHTLVLDEMYTDGTLPDAHAHCVCTWKFAIVRK
jgi:hypothetical protein